MTKTRTGAAMKFRHLTSLAFAASLGLSPALLAQNCNRACLEGFVERYFDALIDNNPAALPISPNVKFTEDGQRLVVGDGLWNTMKAKGDYRLFVTDVPAQQVTVLASIFEDHREATESTPALLALRLRLKSGQIAEIEQMVVRDEDAARRVDDSTPRPGLLADVPRGSRMSRADLISVSDMYFSGMQQ